MLCAGTGAGGEIVRSRTFARIIAFILGTMGCFGVLFKPESILAFLPLIVGSILFFILSIFSFSTCDNEVPKPDKNKLIGDIVRAERELQKASTDYERAALNDMIKMRRRLLHDK